jgi:D-glycero-D-manno-heptose 1,7-bisphosphate phosphatase
MTTPSPFPIPKLIPKQKAIFLDRDGVLNLPVVKEGRAYPPSSVDEFILYPETTAAVNLLKSLGFVLVVATNQPDVGRKRLSQEVVEAMHALLLQWLPIDRVEVCYAAGTAFDQPSDFRKPAPGMLLKAAHEMHLDLRNSFMIGDRWRDIEAGYAAGCRTIWINRGYDPPRERRPNFEVSNIAEAAELISKL